MPENHRAAIVPKAGCSRMEIVVRPTPKPAPNDILIAVKAIAVNPADWSQRDRNIPPLPRFPGILGLDVAGIVAEVGSDVKDGPSVGSRVLAFASSFFKDGALDYGGFQEYVLAGSECVVALPDSISFEEGAVFPLAVFTAMTGYTTVDIPMTTKYSPADKQAILLWGGASSVGTFAIQSAKILGFTVYTTASPRNHEYLKSLGADGVFDYKSSDVVSQIVARAKKDGISLHTAHCIVDGGLQPTLDVLDQTRGDVIAKVAHAPILPPDAPKPDWAVIKFTFPPMELGVSKHLQQIYHEWLATNLGNGQLVPSPHVRVVPGGLAQLDTALDILRDGVSAEKVVVNL